MFPDDIEFSATDTQVDPVLTINAPIGLSFRDNPAPIENSSVALADFTDLNPAVTFDDNLFGMRVPDGKTFALAGGDITADGGGIVAVGGRVELGAVAESGTVGINFEGDNISFSFPDDLARANVSLTNNAGFLVAGSGGGDIAITANNIDVLEGSNLFGGIFSGLGSSNAQAGDITIDATGAVNLVDGSRIIKSVGTDATGNSGDINVMAESLTLTNGASLDARTSGVGNAGDISIKAEEIIFSGSTLFTEVSSDGGIGNAGDINISTNSLSLQNGSSFLADTENIGNAGNIFIEARDSVVLEGLGEDNSQNQITSTVDAGINLDVTGNAGNIEINTDSLSITDAGFISTSTFGNGNGGKITINARESVNLGNEEIAGNLVSYGDLYSDVEFAAIGNSEGIEINTGSLTARNSSQITSQVNGTGNSGDININAQGKVSFDGRDETDSVPSAIFTSIEPNGEGNGGNININAKSLELTNRAQLLSNVEGIGDARNININVSNEFNLVNSDIISEVTEPNENGEGGRGNGGDINIITGSLLLQDGSSLLADTENIGDAGNITIEATESVIIEGEGPAASNPDLIIPSQITSTVDRFEGARGDGGNISISTSFFSIADRGFISTSTSSVGNAGNISIDADRSVSLDDSIIFSNVNDNGVGNAGGIKINANSLLMTNTAQLLSNTRGKGNAGDIDIQVEEEFRLVNSDIISEITEGLGEGEGGDITIKTGSLLLQDGSSFLADTENIGDAGDITIEASDRVVLEGEGPGAQSGTLENGFIIPSQISSTVDANANPNVVGDGGNIRIETPSLTVKDNGFIRTTTFGNGNAGNLTISTQKLRLEGGGELDAITFGDRNAGNLTIQNAEIIEILGTSPDGTSPSGLFASAIEGSGDGGNLSISTNKLIIQDKAAISVGNFQIVFEDRTPRTPGSGIPGTLNIEANSLVLNNGGRIDAATQSEVEEGANINLQIADNIILQNNSFISAQAFGNANGGNLTIDTNFIIAFPNETPGNGNDIIANAVGGKGGNISITAESLLGIKEREAIEGKGTNDIDASSEFSLDGTVTINTPDINPVQGATELPSNVVVPEETTQQACEVNREVEAKNGLSITGKGGIPAEPGLPLDSLNVTINGEANPTSTIPQPIETSQGKIQPARGVSVTESGEIILTAYRTNNAGDRLIQTKRNCSRVKVSRYLLAQ